MIIAIEYVVKTPVINNKTGEAVGNMYINSTAFAELKRREFKVLTSDNNTKEKTVMLNSIHRNIDNAFAQKTNLYSPNQTTEIKKIRKSALSETLSYRKEFGWKKSKSISEVH